MCGWFLPTSTQSLDASCLKTQSTADLKIKETRSAFPVKLREAKRRAKDEDASNKSMDVRAKQRLCYRSFLVNPNLRGGGFAPRHLNRWAAYAAEGEC